MIFKLVILQQIKSGKVNVAFRRWKKPTVKAGGGLHTAAGNLMIDEVSIISEKEISERDALNAGFPDKKTLLKELNKRPEGELYRIRFHYVGEDPRKKLRMKDDLSLNDIKIIVKRLQGMDTRSVNGPWTKKVLGLIVSKPAIRAADLAAELRVEKDWLKTNIRKLKNLGLTESLETGYRISPRGKKILSEMA